MNPDVDVLARFYAAINRGDMAAMAGHLDADVVRVEFEGSPTGGTCRGADAVGDNVRRGRGTWAEGSCEPERYLVNGDRVVVYLHARVRPKGRDDWTGGPFADGFVLRGGRIAEYRSFAERADALEWAGIDDAPAPAMRIAILSAADVPPYKVLMLEAYEHDADAFTSTPEERRREPDAWWVGRIAHPEALTLAFGAFDGHELVGTVALEFSAKPKTRHKALVVGMFVRPGWRRRGIARLLMEAAIAHCVARHDIRLMQLEATDGNRPAIGLYEALGFTVYGVEPMALLTPGGFRAKVHLWLDLAERRRAPGR